MTLIVQAALLFGFAAMLMIPLERWSPMHRGQRLKRPQLTTDCLHAVLTGPIIRIGMIPVVIAVGSAAGVLVPQSVPARIGALPFWAQFVLLFLLSDLMFYLAHRIVHRVPLLWRFHAVHHSSEQLDWVAAHRVHPVDQLFNNMLIALPGLALGFAPGVMIAFALVYRWHALLLHANVRINLGPLARWIATPHFHHWHHAREQAAHDRNFGGQLVIWDRIFGTVHCPPQLPDSYGIEASMPGDYPGQLVHPFRRSGDSDNPAASPATALTGGARSS